MKRHYYSAFWSHGGVLTLPEWQYPSVLRPCALDTAEQMSETAWLLLTDQQHRAVLDQYARVVIRRYREYGHAN